MRFWGEREEEGKKRAKKKKKNPNSLVVLTTARLRAQLRAGIPVGDVFDLFDELGLAVAAPEWFEF